MLGATWPEQWQNLVFLTESGTPVDPANLRRELARIAKAAEVGALRPYDLRHTAASLIAERGARLEDVADVLGHAGTHLARAVYIHATTSTVAHAVAPMTSVLTGDAAEGSQSGSPTPNETPGHAPAVGDN